MKFINRLIKKYVFFFKTLQKNLNRKWKLFQLRVNEIIQSIKSFFIKLWNTFVVIPYKFIAKWWNKLFWKHFVRFCRWISRKTSFFRWKTFSSNTSQGEKDRYTLFIEEVLGGWKNIVAFQCRTKSWHLKVIHSFLIDWERFPHFGIKVVFWDWPYLSLSIGSYSKWIFKRLRKITKMPFRIRKNKKIFKKIIF